MIKERWVICEINENYSVNRSGEVFSNISGKKLKTQTDSNGYLSVNTYRPYRRILVHRLVATAFVKEVSGKKCVNHKNSNRSDNRAINLEWVSHSENSLHASKVGKLGKGSKHANSKLDEKKVREILLRLDSGEVQRRIAEDLGIAYSTITKIKQRNAWKHVSRKG